ncbi:MAG: hypothetical protein CVU13_00050 [Bacteroidetes bacterium HGW-Bacteroidetes-8]|jgi:uncharacterized protein YciI|nr:MAG: hypothetical protein CVU13_00050 [Bacteroidetes bacterium HGW-Bacteroidetes-8]
MKTIALTIISLLFVSLAFSQTNNQNFDSELAKKLGADEYGMKSYILVILKTGSNTTTDKKFIDSCFAGHMSNMGVMVKAGKLVVAGPIGKNENSYRGLFILNAKDFEEATELLKGDPAVKERLLEAQLYNWYGSAALSLYLDSAEKIAKQRR